MPQPSQHPLLYILLLWTTIISIIQAVVIVLFFTLGHNSWSQNNSMVKPTTTMHLQGQTTPSPPFEDRLKLGKGKMLTFKASAANSTIKWSAEHPDPSLISAEGDTLIIKRGGYFFLNLQVTLTSERNAHPRRTVSLELNKEVILLGWFNTNTNSTGLLSKVHQMSTGERMKVAIKPHVNGLNYSKAVTHLDIIYMYRP